MSATTKKTYRANCHCKAFVLEAQMPGEIHTVRECNCSSCAKRGALWAFAKRDGVTFVEGEESGLDTYVFGGFGYKFCPSCGTNLLVTGHDQEGGKVGVNARAVQGLDIWDLEIAPLDGASMSPAYASPKFAGAEPTAELADGRTYYGSCHCGAFRVAFKSKKLDDKDSGVPAFECNCSICQRNAFIGLWIPNDLVAVQGLENLTRYGFNNKLFSRGHCGTCGVAIANKASDMPEAAVAAMPDMARQWYVRAVENWSLNARSLEGVDLKALARERVDGWAFIPPMYENP